MPFSESNYRPSFLLRNGHINTLACFFLRKTAIAYTRQRLTLSDGDFIDLDYSSVGAKTAVLLVHGLEGSSDSGYVKGMAKAVNEAGWDAVAINLRGCSGELNLRYDAYHSGRTEDVREALAHLANQYEKLFLLGFSLGGNLTLKLMGESGLNVPAKLKGAVAISVPCDLRGAADQLTRFDNMGYTMRFLRSLKKKIAYKKSLFPQAELSLALLKKAKYLRDIDDLYTAPAHGFKNAEHYWEMCSANRFLAGIELPTLLINSTDDPFLSPSCHPIALAKAHKAFHFEQTRYGGHVGFAHNGFAQSWHEPRAIEFLKSL